MQRGLRRTPEPQNVRGDPFSAADGRADKVQEADHLRIPVVVTTDDVDNGLNAHEHVVELMCHLRRQPAQAGKLLQLLQLLREKPLLFLRRQKQFLDLNGSRYLHRDLDQALFLLVTEPPWMVVEYCKPPPYPAGRVTQSDRGIKADTSGAFHFGVVENDEGLFPCGGARGERLLHVQRNAWVICCHSAAVDSEHREPGLAQ